MTLASGTTIGSYEIAAQIGAGCMGEVYRATDRKLKRDVAIKVLPDALAADPERLSRFQREAEVLASLNHPNIAHIYGVEDAAGTKALVMELVEGPTLADRILQGPVPVDEALPIAKQVAEALEAAHERGIIHRDLKPANIKVRPDGTVKVLDFGLAKAVEPASATGASAGHGLSLSPTIATPAMTKAGMILGTAAYMAPEQARGRDVDKRADIWAFGCVLFEMLSGSRVFAGEEVADTLALVLTREPDWSTLPTDTPRSLAQVIRRCLIRDPRRRLRDIGDARIRLQDLVEGINEDGDRTPGPASMQKSWWQPTRLGAAALVLLTVGVAVGSFGRSLLGRQPKDGVRRFEITSRGFELRDTPGRQGMDIAVSPDGGRIVYAGETDGSPRLYVRSLDRLEPRMLAGLSSPQNPFLSADGQWVGFLGGSELKKINIDGGAVATIANLGATSLEGASWGADNVITFATNAATGLLRVSADGGTPEVIASPDLQAGEAAYRYPEMLPDGRTVLFTVIDTSGTIDNARVVALNLDTGVRTVLVRGAGQARYMPTGHLVYGIGGELRAVPFDAATLTVTGTPVTVVTDVVTTELGGANFGVATDGTLVYAAGSTVADRNELVWVDRQGREEVVRPWIRAFRQARISPDGTRVALDIRDLQNDIWIWEIANGTLTRLTTDPLLDRQPIWSPDGRYIVFTSDRAGTVNLFRTAADGTGTPEQLTEGPGAPYATSYSPDGARLIFWWASPARGLDLAMLPLSGDRRPTTLLAAGGDQRNAELSPDGRWLAYQSTESGRNEIYVQPFPKLEGRSQISNDGGSRPMWGRDGRELFYWMDDGRLMVTPVEAAPAGSPFPKGRPRVLFERNYPQPLNSRTFDITPDGKRFLFIRPAANDPTQRPVVVLVQHWLGELERLVPTH